MVDLQSELIRKRQSLAYQKEFRLGAIVVSVNSYRTAGLERMRHYIARESETGKGEFGEFTLSEIADDQLFSQVMQMIDTAPCLRTVQVYMNRPMLHWKLGNADVFKDREEPNLILKSGPHIALISPSGIQPSVNELLRIFREIYYRWHILHNRLFFHAGAMSAEDRGILILGPSGSGKTTLITTLAETGRFDFLGNDRISISNTSRHLHSFPMQIRIGAENFRHSRLHAAFRQHPEYFDRSVPHSVLHAEDGRHNMEAEKAELSPLAFCSLYGIRFLDKAPWHVTIIPDLDLHNPESLSVSPISRAEAYPLLRAEFTNVNDYVWPEPWLIPVTHEDSCQYDTVLNRITEQVPFFRLRFHPDFIHSVSPDKIISLILKQSNF